MLLITNFEGQAFPDIELRSRLNLRGSNVVYQKIAVEWALCSL